MLRPGSTTDTIEGDPRLHRLATKVNRCCCCTATDYSTTRKICGSPNRLNNRLDGAIQEGGFENSSFKTSFLQWILMEDHRISSSNLKILILEVLCFRVIYLNFRSRKTCERVYLLASGRGEKIYTTTNILFEGYDVFGTESSKEERYENKYVVEPYLKYIYVYIYIQPFQFPPKFRIPVKFFPGKVYVLRGEMVERKERKKKKKKGRVTLFDRFSLSTFIKLIVSC